MNCPILKLFVIENIKFEYFEENELGSKWEREALVWESNCSPETAGFIFVYLEKLKHHFYESTTKST